MVLFQSHSARQHPKIIVTAFCCSAKYSVPWRKFQKFLEFVDMSTVTAVLIAGQEGGKMVLSFLTDINCVDFYFENSTFHKILSK